MIDISLLKKINILQEVEDKHLEKISKICKLIHYNTPTVLFEYGSKTNSIFMILDGSVDHLLPSKDNKLIKIYQSRTGETIGLSALLPREYVALFTAST
ncbi:cyclic nucleotide-binding domain-containing protein, partial [Desulfothermus okinawensis]